MKKILHIAEPFATGVLSFLSDLTRYQVNDFDIYIIYGIRPLTPSNVEDLFDKRIHLIRLDSFNGALKSVLNPKVYFEISKLFKQIKPDIVHLHSSAAGFVGRWAISAKRCPIVYTPHGYSFLMKDCNVIKRSIYRFMEWVSAQRGGTTIACSEGEYKEAIKLSPHCTYVNNGINIDQLRTFVNYKEIGDKIKVCTSGRILYQKNPKLFNEIAQLLPEFEFIWIGEGELKTELTSPNIKVTGWCKREDTLKILQDAQFFILPSLWEGLPISLLEAMYLKKICLVSNVIGNRDVIKSGRNGIICNTAADYANNIKEIVLGRINGCLLAENASKDVDLVYNVEKMASNYKTKYITLINKHK